jgi:cytochrome P450
MVIVAVRKSDHFQFTELSKFGEMTTLRLGSRTWILLNNQRVTREIIAKRGNITSERHHLPVASGIVSRGMRSILQPLGKWTENRRVMHHLLSGSALDQYGEWQQLESTQMLAEYLHHPDQWYSHHYRYASSVVHRVALGVRVEASGEDLSNLQKIATEFTGSIGSCLVDWFPAVAMIPKPFQRWRPSWEKMGKFHNDVYHKWFDPVLDAIKAGAAPPSFARDVLMNPESAYKGNSEEAMCCAMQVVGAGSDTTRQALNVFIMAMIEHPEVFAKVRAEVDSVCKGDGNLRMPDIADIKSLPYTAATLKEVLRWRPIFVLSPEHTLSSDLEFEGYRFPAGVGFVINMHTVANDCDDCHAFRPERWMDGNEMNVLHGLWGFGGGMYTRAKRYAVYFLADQASRSTGMRWLQVR